ncbi:MAG TPA: hypothetical protein VIL69_17145 [Roseomonas sp.]|jgi:hypothetical protein
MTAGELLLVAGVVVGVALVLLGLAALARRARRRGTAGSAIAGAMAAYDEGFHGTAHDSYVELQADADRTVPAPAPGDPEDR